MKRFYNLKFGDKFSVNEVVYQKENFFSAVRSLGTRDNWAGDAPLYRHYYPWAKVQPVYVDPFPGISFGVDSHPLRARRFSSPPPLGQRIMTRDCDPYEKYRDDNRSGPSA